MHCRHTSFGRWGDPGCWDKLGHGGTHMPPTIKKNKRSGMRNQLLGDPEKEPVVGNIEPSTCPRRIAKER